VTKHRGRDQRQPMERLVRIAAVLRVAGDRGVPVAKLVEVAGFEQTESGRDQLARELRHLTRQGWQIENIAGSGEHARYRMSAVDNRLRVRLTPGQQRELRRAVLLVDRADLVRRLGLPESERPSEAVPVVPLGDHDDRLATVVRAVRMGCLLKYRYAGSRRLVHPQSVRTQNGKWYLHAREEGGELLKAFVVSRMSDVEADEPGTAHRDPTARHAGLHPMTWEIDPPVEVTLRAPVEYRLDVHRWLGAPSTEVEQDGAVTMRYSVTHRAALRDRLYELGPRVELVGPEEVRQELLAELRAVVEADR
jgi:predicted DNA-binding transcriptional regulator YafY